MVKIAPISVFLSTNPLRTSTKPYDVISEEERKQLAKDEASFVHVILPEGDGDERYDNAKKALQELISNGWFKREGPALYLYSESRGDFRQRGIIGGFDLKAYGEGRIKRHEKTREKPLKDRIKHIEKLGAQTGLVWLLVKGNERLKRLMDKIQEEEPLFDFEKYGWRHRLWKINEDIANEIIEVLEPEDLYIADGHHRIAAAYEYAKKMWDKEGKGPWDYVMAFVANDDEVRILPYDRVIKTLPMPFESFLKRVEEKFDVVEGFKDPEKGEILMFHDKWYRLIPKEIPKGVVEQLDVAILQNYILSPILGIENPRKDPNIFFVGGELNREDLEALGKENALVFHLHPTNVREVEAVADAGLDMPPKSTWFDPKLLSGIMFYPLKEEF